MKTLTMLLLLLSSCAPWKETPVTGSQAAMMMRDEAVADWKESQSITDECSSPPLTHFLAETFLDKNWQDCCWQHDFDYKYGHKYGIEKKQADYSLWQCVVDSGHPFVANLIYDGVDLGGKKYYVTGD